MQAAAESGDEGAVYNIGTAARKSGLSVTTIRTWEDRYGAVVPIRDASGRRLYSSDQIAQLTWLRQQIDAGLRASEAHRLLMAGEADTAPGPAAVVDQTTPWTTLLGWSKQEAGWIGSVLNDLRRGLRAGVTALGVVLENPLRGPVFTVTAFEPAGNADAVRPIGLIVLDEAPALASALEGDEAVTVGGGDLGLDIGALTVAPVRLARDLAGAVVGVDAEVTEPGALVERAVRVIESRIEADRARSAFSSLLD